MPDNTKNFSYDGTNGPIGNTTVTRAELIEAMEHMNYASGNVRSIDELGSNAGFTMVDGAGAAGARTFLGSTGLTWTNANGSGGNPTVRIGSPSTARQTLNDTESNVITADVALSILSSGTSYSVPAPTVGVISEKTITNATASMITLTGSVWANPGITTVRIEPYGSVRLVSNLVSSWAVMHPYPEEGYGDIYLSTGGTTTVALQSTWYPENSTWSLGTHLNQFTIDSGSRLKYTGKVPGTAHVAIALSLKPAAGTNQDLGLTLGWYDASATTTYYEDEYKIIRRFANSSDYGSITVDGVITMDEGDYVFAAVENTSSTNNIDGAYGTVTAEIFPNLTT